MGNKPPVPKRPVPQLSCEDGGTYLAAVCPHCGEYPGGDGLQTCQHCGRQIFAEGRIVYDKPRGFWARLFGA